MLRFCGLLTLALNTAGSIATRQYGTALVDAVGPALLTGWSEAGPWMLRQIHAVRPAAGSLGRALSDAETADALTLARGGILPSVGSPEVSGLAHQRPGTPGYPETLVPAGVSS
jgi:hypothetical protein